MSEKHEKRIEFEKGIRWEEKLNSIVDEVDKFLFCLKTVYKTEILQNVERAKKEPELKLLEPKLFRLSKKLAEFLIYINRVKDEDYPVDYIYAFGPLEEYIQEVKLFYDTPSKERDKVLNFMKSISSGIPRDIDNILTWIKKILDRFDIRDLKPFETNHENKCRMFLGSWIAIANSSLNLEKEIKSWKKEKNRNDILFYSGKRTHPKKIEHKIDYDEERRILIGNLEDVKNIKNVFRNIKDFWEFYLRNKKHLNLRELSRLFKTDLTCVNEEDKWPVIDGKEDSCEIFRRSIIIKKAYENNKSKVEEIISGLKTESKTNKNADLENPR